MPPQRTPLRSIDTNYNKRGPDLTPYQRRRISALCDAGLSPREIELQEKQSRGAVRSTLRLQDINTDRTSQPRSGRPSLYNIRDQRTMLQHMRKYPKSTFQERRKETGLKMSNSTIKRLVRENSLHYWRAKKRPELSDKNAAERLLWCRYRVHWTVEQ
jgi:transposase